MLVPRRDGHRVGAGERETAPREQAPAAPTAAARDAEPDSRAGDGLDAERLAHVALVAEEAGFDSGWVTDHLVVPPKHAPVYGTIAEPLVALGFLAARTRTLELGVSALVVPQRSPLVELKQLTT